MPRNGSGTMSVPNSFSPNTDALSGQVNANFADVASEITNSLPRDGQSGMTGQLKGANGTQAAPGLSFGSDTDTGIYRKSGNTMGVVAGGVEVATIDGNGIADANGVVVSGLPTGSAIMFTSKTAPSGWVRANGRTIGSLTSGGTERANADCEALYLHLWTNFADDECPVAGGRGLNAAADWAANKPIGLPNWRARAPIGLADMGNTALSLIDAITASATVLGKLIGSAVTALIRSDLPREPASVTVSITDPGHSHSFSGKTGSFSTAAGGGNSNGGNDSGNTSSTTTGITASGSFNLNGDVTQTNVKTTPAAFLITYIIKL